MKNLSFDDIRADEIHNNQKLLKGYDLSYSDRNTTIIISYRPLARGMKKYFASINGILYSQFKSEQAAIRSINSCCGFHLGKRAYKKTIQ